MSREDNAQQKEINGGISWIRHYRWKIIVLDGELLHALKHQSLSDCLTGEFSWPKTDLSDTNE